jgi:hypothetical protein
LVFPGSDASVESRRARPRSTQRVKF